MWTWIWFGVMMLSSCVCAGALLFGRLTPFMKAYRAGKPKDIPDYELPYGKLISWSAVVCLICIGGLYLSGNNVISDYRHAHGYPMLPYDGWPPAALVVAALGLLLVFGRKYLLKRAENADPGSLLHYSDFSWPVAQLIGLAGLVLINLAFLIRVLSLP